MSSGNIPIHVRSPQVKFRWAGWTATPLDLERAGWEISISQDPQYQEIYFALHNREGRVSGISQRIPSYELREQTVLNHHRELGVGMSLGQTVMIQMQESILNSFNPLDVQSTVQFRRVELGNFNIFQTIPKSTEQYLLDDVSLDQILSIALEKQKPIEEQYTKYKADQTLLQKYAQPKAMLRLVA